MDKLNQLIRQKRYRAADNLLRKMVEQAPEDGYLLTRMAVSLWNDRKNEEALQYADRAKKVEPTDPYVIYTRARVLWALDKNEEAIAEWDNILNMSEHDLKESGYRPMWIKTFVNEARYYKALSLRALFRDKEALALMEEHLKHRGKGVQSDFTKKEATLLYKELKYSDFRPYVSETAEGFSTSKQDKQVFKRLNELEGGWRHWKMPSNGISWCVILKVFASVIPRNIISMCDCLNTARRLGTRPIALNMPKRPLHKKLTTHL